MPYSFEASNPVRQKFVDELKKNFGEDGLKFSIGGQISIDIFPNGWDKTFCLRYLEPRFNNIHFFGDKTFPVFYMLFIHIPNISMVLGRKRL